MDKGCYEYYKIYNIIGTITGRPLRFWSGMIKTRAIKAQFLKIQHIIFCFCITNKIYSMTVLLVIQNYQLKNKFCLVRNRLR